MLRNVFRKLRGRKTLLQQGQIEKFSVSFVSRKQQSEGGPADVSRLQVLTIVQEWASCDCRKIVLPTQGCPEARCPWEGED